MQRSRTCQMSMRYAEDSVCLSVALTRADMLTCMAAGS